LASTHIKISIKIPSISDHFLLLFSRPKRSLVHFSATSSADVSWKPTNATPRGQIYNRPREEKSSLLRCNEVLFVFQGLRSSLGIFVSHRMELARDFPPRNSEKQRKSMIWQLFTFTSVESNRNLFPLRFLELIETCNNKRCFHYSILSPLERFGCLLMRVEAIESMFVSKSVLL
jgi:hypothetical protein